MNRLVAASLIAATLSATPPAHADLMGFLSGTERPAATEFGVGPRVSAKHLYTARLEPREPLRLRELQAMTLVITNANGQPVDDATIAIDGGMPQHHHGLPTQPRVARMTAPGTYEIDGVRFSMGGWWELKLAIDSPAGADRVTFNLSL